MALPRPRRILVTGIGGVLAGMLARVLERRDDVEHVVGVDVREPRVQLARTELVRAELANPLVTRVVESSRVDTVVHLSTLTGPAAAGGRAAMKERNVIGAMQLFAAAGRSEHVRQVVVKSTTAVYGSTPSDPAVFTEDDAPATAPSGGYSRDAADVESSARSLARRRPDLDLTVLRFANFLGGEIDSVFASFFALPVVPQVAGFDPRVQFVHEDDAVAVLLRAVAGAPPGTYNVAGPGVLYLSQCVRLAGRVPVPVPSPLSGTVARLVRRSRVDVTAEQLRFLRHGRVVDTTRLLERFGYEPAYDSRAAFEDFAARRRIRGMVDRDEVARLEVELEEFLSRRGLTGPVTARRGGVR